MDILHRQRVQVQSGPFVRVVGVGCAVRYSGSGPRSADSSSTGEVGGVIWDRPTDPIVRHFTPRQLAGGLTGERAHALNSPMVGERGFINELNGYTQDERIVYDDGFDETNAHLFEGIEFPGVTDPDLIWKHGRFHIAQSRLRPEKITISVGWGKPGLYRGDRVSGHTRRSDDRNCIRTRDGGQWSDGHF